jgi:hypothetical protein
VKFVEGPVSAYQLVAKTEAKLEKKYEAGVFVSKIIPDTETKERTGTLYVLEIQIIPSDKSELYALVQYNLYSPSSLVSSENDPVSHLHKVKTMRFLATWIMWSFGRFGRLYTRKARYICFYS